jgi:hypothetical protein
LKSSYEEQTGGTNASGESSDFEANWESLVKSFSVVVSCGDFRNYGIRAADRDSAAAALLGAAFAANFVMARSSCP